MKTLVRTLLVWFVLLAVPFQGFAAAAMTCAHGVSTASTEAPAQPPCHGDSAQPAKHGAGHAVNQDGGHGDDSPHQKSCGNCATCSVGAAMAPASNAQAPSCCPCSCCPSAVPARVALADPDLPDRPPRTTPVSRS